MKNKINISKVRQFYEDKINKKISEINDPSINLEKKRLYVLDQLNSSKTSEPIPIDFPNNKFILFDMNKVREMREKKIEEKILNRPDEKLSINDKRLLVLDEMNTSLSSNNEEEEKGIINKIEEEEKGIINKIEEEEKGIINKIEEEEKEKENNSLSTTLSLDISTSCSFSSFPIFSSLDIEKKNYWLQYKLYDIKQFENLKYPILFPIKEEIYSYFYYNELTTSHYIQSIQFGKEYSINNDIVIDDNYNNSLGLFFCGKEIILENNEIKKCCPNEMICRECMEKNKKRYKLKDRYSININGRAAKKYENNFHCFGHFIIGKQIENCLGKFSCEACKLLDKYEKYYFP